MKLKNITINALFVGEICKEAETKKYNNQEKLVPKHFLGDFLYESDGKRELIQVKSSEPFNLKAYSIYTITVDVSCFNSNFYFSLAEKVEQAKEGK